MILQALNIAVGVLMYTTYVVIASALWNQPEHHWGMRRENHC